MQVNRFCSLEIRGETLWLLAEKAVYLPAREMLLIADAHFGKAAAYRALGQPVPQGTTNDNLKRLDHLLAHYPSRSIVFLGDFLHAPASHAPATLAAIAAWRVQHSGVECMLVRGNHDLRAGGPPDYLNIRTEMEPLIVGELALCHEPQQLPMHHVIAGHIHPACLLQGRGRQRMRLPCFMHEKAVTVLPAFGDFTGGMDVEPKPGRRLFVASEAGIWPLPSV